MRWTGFNERVQHYQGQIADKGFVQKRYEEKLAVVASDRRRQTEYDFSGVTAMFDEILRGVAGR